MNRLHVHIAAITLRLVDELPQLEDEDREAQAEMVQRIREGRPTADDMAVIESIAEEEVEREIARGGW